MKAVIVLLSLAIAAPLAAQAGQDRILMPITTASAPGAFGSMWVTELWYRNDSDVGAVIQPLIVSDAVPTLRMTLPLRIFQPPPGRPPGQFIYVTHAAAGPGAVPHLQPAQRADGAGFSHALRISLADAFPAMRGAKSVRIEITPLTAGAAIWAFISITNDETQQVSLVTPQ